MKVTNKTLDDVDLKIIELISTGKTYKEIARKLSKNKDAIQYRVTLMKRAYRCDNVAALILQLSENIVQKTVLL